MNDAGGETRFAPALRFRECVRALIVTPERDVLLLHLVVPDRTLWITPGGGIGQGESHVEALRRELVEEIGRGDLEIGPRIWIRHGRYRWAGQWTDEREHFYLIRCDRFDPDASQNPVEFERNALAEMRWWSADALPDESKEFAPMRIGALVKRLLEEGAPSEPLETGF